MNQSEEKAGGLSLSTAPAIVAGNIVTEPTKKIEIRDEADVIVVGGGPGGMGAAVSAARNGAKTIIVERYGCLGGMATGGLVTIIPNLADNDGNIIMKGLNEEIVERLRARNACHHPPKELVGSTDPESVAYYKSLSMFYARDRVNYAIHVDAEELKCVFDEMVEEANIKTYLHSWGTSAIVDPETKKVCGVVFESKSGRQAILGKVVIDCTGDGDLLPSAGASFETDIPKGMRISNASHCFWIANVDWNKFKTWRDSDEGAKQFAAQAQELAAIGGHPRWILSNLPNQEGLLWFHPATECLDQCDVEALTKVEFAGRKKMKKTLDYRRTNTPGFEKSYAVVSSPQLGTRCSRRVIGEYMLNKADADAGKTHEDTVALFPRGDAHHLHVPYRALVPRGVEGLLVACRATSMDIPISEHLNLINHCVAFGQAAGVAAAQAVKAGVGVRDIDIKALQADLKKQDVILP